VPASTFYTLGRWALTTTFCGIFSIPARLLQRFVRKQQIIVQPVLREDGARKKRIIDAGPADEPNTPTPAPRARSQIFRRGRGRGGGRVNVAPASPINLAPSPTLPTTKTPSPIKDAAFSCTTPPWLASLLTKKAAAPSPPVPVDITQDVSDTNVNMDADDNDESIDWSFEGAWVSPVPVDRPADYLQGATHHSEGIQEAPSASLPLEHAAAAAPLHRVTNFSRSSPVIHQQLRALHDISPNTHLNIIRRASVTPMRKMLLKRQVTTQAALEISVLEAENHIVPSPAVATPQHTGLQQKTYDASMFKKHAEDIASRAKEASERYRAEAETRQNITSEISPAEQQYFNFTATIDQDLSFLSDAFDDDEDEEVAQTLHSPEPSAPRQRSVRWSSHATAKPFYCDEKIADMLDSTLETIHSSPSRAYATDHFSEDDTSEDDAANVSDVSRSPSVAGSSTQRQAGSTESAGFTGVPSSTWDDSEDSLDESQISLELLGDLQKELQEKLALAPPSPPPPVKALITPISEEEHEKLDATATRTDNGKNASMWIVNQKINAHDFSTLLPTMFNGDPRAWLNDNIVNEYVGILVAGAKKKAGFEPKRGGPAPPVHAFSSFWYPTMKDKKYPGVARWAARFQLAGEQYLDADLLLYPICDGGHWRLLVVKPKDRTIEYLDSLGWDGSKYVKQLKDYLAAELKEAWNEEDWTVLSKQRSTPQVNGSDCGVFAVLNALALLRGEEFTKVLACDGMLDARERIATTLIAGAPTTEFD
jgi:hypothetical protein